MGSEGSNEYQIFLLILFLINMLFRIDQYIRIKRIKVIEIAVLLIPILFFCLILSNGVRYGYFTGEVKSHMVYLLVWQYMAIFAVLNLRDFCDLSDVIDALDWFVLIVFLGGLRAVLASAGDVSNSLDTFGGATYQSASYFMAFAFGINTFLLMIKKKTVYLSRLNIVTNSVCRMFLSAALVCFVLFTGGRAGIVLIMVYLSVLTWWTFQDERFSFTIWILGFLMCMGLLAFIVTVLIDHPIFYTRIHRVFEYISGAGIDFSKTSGRDIIYGIYQEFIKERPIAGYGILASSYLEHYEPHNFILQVLFEGGFLYLLFWTGILAALYSRWRNQEGLEKYFLIIVMLYPLIHLMFSANYVIDEVFWFSLIWAVLIHGEKGDSQKVRKRV
ncbi:MAG: O-antigen ligase family protein [Lachnospiraceae bacterium]|nr:O-antigen ligase family protein [Lachnospiraceae bacterium]